MRLTDKAYKVIKYGITIFLPAVGTLYFALAQVWDFNRITGVNGTINALITFGGLLIGYSTRQYNKNEGAPDGDLVVMADPDDGSLHPALGVNGSLEELVAKDQVKLTVVDKTQTDPRLHLPPDTPVNPGSHPPFSPPVQD